MSAPCRCARLPPARTRRRSRHRASPCPAACRRLGSVSAPREIIWAVLCVLRTVRGRCVPSMSIRSSCGPSVDELRSAPVPARRRQHCRVSQPRRAGSAPSSPMPGWTGAREAPVRGRVLRRPSRHVRLPALHRPPRSPAVGGVVGVRGRSTRKKVFFARFDICRLSLSARAGRQRHPGLSCRALPSHLDHMSGLSPSSLGMIGKHRAGGSVEGPRTSSGCRARIGVAIKIKPPDVHLEQAPEGRRSRLATGEIGEASPSTSACPASCSSTSATNAPRLIMRALGAIRLPAALFHGAPALPFVKSSSSAAARWSTAWRRTAGPQQPYRANFAAPWAMDGLFHPVNMQTPKI